MTNHDAILALFIDGGRIAHIAEAIQDASDSVEDAIRSTLRTIREEYGGALGAPSPAPQMLPARKKQTYRKQARPTVHAAELAASPVRKAVAKAANPPEHAEFPEPLRHPLAIKQRALYLMLQEGPKDVAELVAMAEQAGVQESDLAKWVGNGLYGMQQKDVVVKPDKPGGKWRLA